MHHSTMLDCADDLHWNADEQFGSKTSHSAQDLSLNTCLIDDIIYLLHSNGVICSNNAKNYYGHIIYTVLALAL